MKIISFLLLVLSSTLASGHEFYEIDEAKSYQEYSYDVPDQKVGGYKIAAHLWSNDQKKLMLVAHGYSDNCGYAKPLIRWFLVEGYDVLCIELPGHGNSSGKRADISQIEAYYEVYKTVLPQVFALNYPSISFYGHSTGNSGMIEYLLDQNTHRFDKMVMATPLIRSYLWKLSRFAHRLSRRFLQNLPKRSFKSELPEYKELVKLDPNPLKSIPTNFFNELILWNDKLIADPRISQERFTVIFSEKDTVIDYKYNKRFMSERFPQANIVTIEKSDHNLHYQKKAIRDEFYQKLSSILNAE